MGNPLGGGVASTTYSGKHGPGRFIKRHRVSTALVTAGAVIASTVGVAGLTSVPAGADTTTTSFVNQCRAVSSVLNVNKPQDTQIFVDAPESVEQGEIFTMRIQPTPGVLPNSDSGATTKGVYRMKNDYEIPSNTTFISGTVVPKEGDALGYGSTPDELGNYPGGVNVFSDVAPDVRLIDGATGLESATGDIIRISGANQTIGNGLGNTGSAGGITLSRNQKQLDGSSGGTNTYFQLPAIEITLQATGEVGSTIEPKTRQSMTYNANGNPTWWNTSAALANASVVGDTWARTYCRPATTTDGNTPNAGFGALASIEITGSADVETATVLDVPATAETGETVSLSASVSPNPASGSVEFFVDGDSVGSASVDGSGVAAVDTSFDPAGTYEVTAVYSGAEGFAGSSATPVSIEVSDVDPPEPTEASVTFLNSSASTLTVGDSATLVASVISPEMVGVPTGSVEFFDGAGSLGTAALDETGTAYLGYDADDVGGHVLSAAYLGDDTFVGSNAFELVSVAAVGAVDNPAEGEMVIQASSEEPIGAPIPVGTNLVSVLAEDGGVTDLSGTFNFAPQIFEPIPGVFAQSALGTSGPVTGEVDAEGDATLSFDLVMQLVGISLDGGATYDAMGDDCLIGGIPVNASGAQDEFGLVSVSEAGFEIPLLADDACGGLGSIMNMFLAGSDTTISLNVQLPYTPPPIENGLLTGFVRDGASAPIQGGKVVALDATTGVAVGSSSTISNGRYNITVPAGDYKLKFTKSGYVTTFNGGGTSFEAAPVISLGADATVSTNIIVGLVPAKVTGILTSTDGGAPVSGVKATLYLADDCSAMYRQGQTLSSGKYNIPDVPEGQYKLQFKKNNAPKYETHWVGGGTSCADAATVTIGSGINIYSQAITPQ